MSSNKTIGLVLAIAGAVLALVGIVCLSADDISSSVAYALIGIGAVAVVVGVIFMYFLDCSCTSKVPGSAPKKKAASKKADLSGLGDGPIAKAIRYGSEKIDAKVAEGKMTEAQGQFQLGRLMAYANVSGKEEEAAMIEVSQILGAIAEA